jgi:L-amino acid N-acyltransferase YncA
MRTSGGVEGAEGEGVAAGGAARLRAATAADAAAVAEILAHYVRETICTWAEEVPSAGEWELKIAEARSKGWPFLVADLDGQVVGYACVGLFRVRSGWRFTCENSIYVRDGFQRRGLGPLLLGELLSQAKAAGFTSVVAMISLDPSPAPDAGWSGHPSIALHSKFGFVEAGRLPRAGFKFGRWLDCVIMQATLA